MLNSKYSKLLTIILIVAIVAIIGLLIFVGLNWYKAYSTGSEVNEFFNQFNDYVENLQEENNEIENIEPQNLENIEVNVIEPIIDENSISENQTSGENENGNSSNSQSNVTYKGKKVVGTIEIPKTNVKYPILSDASSESIEIAIGMLYGPGINKVGNTVLAGHNFKDGTFFSNNKKLSVGDKIYITDLNGKKVTYVISKKYTTTTNDFDYATRDTKGKRAISLTTCTDDTNSRIIIWAEEK